MGGRLRLGQAPAVVTTTPGRLRNRPTYLLVTPCAWNNTIWEFTFAAADDHAQTKVRVGDNLISIEKVSCRRVLVYDASVCVQENLGVLSLARAYVCVVCDRL